MESQSALEVVAWIKFVYQHSEFFWILLNNHEIKFYIAVYARLCFIVFTTPIPPPMYITYHQCPYCESILGYTEFYNNSTMSVPAVPRSLEIFFKWGMLLCPEDMEGTAGYIGWPKGQKTVPVTSRPKFSCAQESPMISLELHTYFWWEITREA